MGAVNLKTPSGGSVILSPANTAADVTITVPASNGTMVTTASTAVVTASMLSTPTTFGVVQAASGTTVDFTGIPSWAKRICIMFNSVSTTGTSVVLVRLGTSAGVVATGYTGAASYALTTVGTAVFTTGLAVGNNYSASCFRTGVMELLNLSSNTWIGTTTISSAPTTETGVGTGILGLPNTLDRIQITTVNGTDTFDNGSINIVWEG